ncbi:hypothetical protein AAVH_01303 [Aphelenchoides avenae]|nr:hypothetical protein AAVH_01303 [Aphelenchus avenae]
MERKTSTTGSDLPSPHMSADFFDRDPRMRKRLDSDALPVPVHVPSVKATVDPNDVKPDEARLNQTPESAETKERKTIEVGNTQKRSNNIGELVGSHFDNMKAHYKKEVKKLADKCNELKKVNGKLRQEKDEQQQQYELSVQKMKMDVDNAERSIKEGLLAKIKRLENDLNAAQETLERRQEAELTYQTEQAIRLRKCEEEKETLRRKHHEHIESYVRKVDKLNKEKDGLYADNVEQKTKQGQLSAQLDDSKRRIFELQKALTERDTAVESQKKTIEQLERAIQAQRQQVRDELVKFVERMEQTL